MPATIALYNYESINLCEVDRVILLYHFVSTMRLPFVVTLAAAVILSAAGKDADTDALVQGPSSSLRGTRSVASLHGSQLSVITENELEAFGASTLELGKEIAADQDQGNRELGFCGDDEKVFKVDLVTTTDGSKTSWRLFRHEASKNKWERVALGPDGTASYGNKMRYTQRICIAPALYAFVMRDGNKQSPEYTCYFKGNKIFQNQGDLDERQVHYFTYSEETSPPPTSQPSPAPTPGPTFLPTPLPTFKPLNPDINGRLANCNWDERLFTINLKTDGYGKEISWFLKNKEGIVVLKNDQEYKNNVTDVVEACIPPDAYALTMLDGYGDGIRPPGYYKIYIDGVLKFESKGRSYKTKVHAFDFGSQNMTERDQQWLDSHNTRRQKWHKKYGKEYVPLKWSSSLKESSQTWAKELLKTCDTKLYHDPDNNKYGENLASNFGTGSFAAVMPTEKILGRFVEWEVDWPWPRCAHFTQVIWRGSDHVGCAEMARDLGDGKKCHVQVCRYTRAGNCDMKSFNDGSEKWWMNAVMQDESNCGAECPPDGCII